MVTPPPQIVYIKHGTVPRVRVCLVFGWLYGVTDFHHTTRCTVATPDCRHVRVTRVMFLTFFLDATFGKIRCPLNSALTSISHNQQILRGIYSKSPTCPFYLHTPSFNTTSSDTDGHNIPSSSLQQGSVQLRRTPLAPPLSN